MTRLSMDDTMKKLLLRLQEGLLISVAPYKALSQELGVEEGETIKRLGWLRRKGYLRRIGFSMNTRKLGLTSTLVALSVPPRRIAKAQKVIAAYGNITHNYLRCHRLNMWFTLTASSKKMLGETLKRLKQELMADELISLPTKEVFKLRFRLHAV
ncbi:MAG: Lrp/AsnC family transcriptional regulator [Candidatus Omnitrophica bacterium]|nr:Lrp/AsnC family transcriptional regulator [Candidatus Omnitrophota bacterium]